MITRSQQLLGRPYPRSKAIQHDLVYLEGLYFQGRNAVWSILSEARFLWQVLNLSYSLKRLQTAWCGTGTWRFNSWLVKSLQALGRTACQRYTDCTHRFCTALSIEMFNVFPRPWITTPKRPSSSGATTRPAFRFSLWPSLLTSSQKEIPSENPSTWTLGHLETLGWSVGLIDFSPEFT